MSSSVQIQDVDFNYYSVDPVGQCPAAKAVLANYVAGQLTPDAQSIGLDVLSSFLAYFDCPSGICCEAASQSVKVDPIQGCLFKAVKHCNFEHMLLLIDHSVILKFCFVRLPANACLLKMNFRVADGGLPVGPLPGVPSGHLLIPIILQCRCSCEEVK